MNTDPGYMSAAPEMDGVEDGAGKVLWPVAIGEWKGHLSGSDF